MYNQYGNSSYHPTHIHGAAKENRPKKTQHPLLRKVLKWVLIIFGTIFIFIWLLLGDFRFMMTKYFSLSGFPFGERTYLVLFQNNYELRPTGGFISSYGVLRFSNGIYRGIDFHDVYDEIDDHEYVEPPLVLATLLEDENYNGHTFRDANFDPDFTKAKDDITEFYKLTNPDTKIDGVIAADFTFLENLVALYEPLTVDEYELTKTNLFETLSTVVSDIDRHNEEALANRKNISGELVKKIIKKTIFFPWRIPGFLSEFSRGFEEKHILAAFNRSGLSKAFFKRNWDGHIPESNLGDFIAVNEGNYGGMKSDRYITRDVTYEIEITGAGDIVGNPIVKAKTTITMTHNGTYNTPLSGDYSGYLRTMIPLGSDVISGTGMVTESDNALIFSELIELPVGASSSYTYAYELPEYVWSNGYYNLKLFKQPGTIADHYRVIVKVPQGHSIESPLFDVRENVAFFETNLLTDVDLSFTVLPDSNPPRIISHEITALNEITVEFNEALSADYAGSGFNYQVTDTNYTDSSVTDGVKILSARVEGSKVVLTTSGMTAQLDERYFLELRDIRDLSGNLISPSPRIVTVIIKEKILNSASE